jgi:tetratricopeptide (TPR) repeat protein
MPPPRQRVFANRIFVDREIPQKIFEDAAFNISPERSAICVFYGAGGQGKTALCRELIRKTNAAVDPSYDFLRVAELDLHGRNTEDGDLFLVWIRNSFVQSGFDLPAFDLALAIAWEATRPEAPFPKLLKPWLGKITEGTKSGVDQSASAAADWLKSDAATDLVGHIVGEIPGIGFLLRKIGRWAIDKSKIIYLHRTRESLKKLYTNGELKKPFELSALLPWMMAKDLNYYIDQHPDQRLVLFIDEYERVFEEGGAGARWRENPVDANIRTLIQYTNALLVVFFSRERLPWKDDPDWREDLKNSQHLLGGLSEKDADELLREIPVEEAAIRDAIIAGARESSDSDAHIYPLILDLQIEHWLHLRESGAAIGPDTFKITATSFEGRRREVVTRVLRDYGSPLQITLERLAVARRFDRRAFAHVIQTFGTALPIDQFDQVAQLSFVTVGEDGFLTIHNAIAETIRETLTIEKRRSSIDALFEHFEARVKIDLSLEITRATVTALIETSFLRRALGIKGYATWLNQLSEAIHRAAEFAIPSLTALWIEAINHIEAFYGPKHPDLAIALSSLGTLLWSQGDLVGARSRLDCALAIREETLGSEHPETAATLDRLAGLIRSQGDLDGARRLFDRALAIREKELGPEHPDTATTLRGLAGLLQVQGDLALARRHFERALAICKKTRGPDDLETASCLDELGVLTSQQGNPAGGQPLIERALAIREKRLGAQHSATGTSVSNLAAVRWAQHDAVGAQRLFERARAIYEKALGPDHPYIARTFMNLARLHLDQGDRRGARSLLERALMISETATGPESPETALNLHQLATFLYSQDDFVAARPLFERVLSIYKRVYGVKHRNTVAIQEYLKFL